MEFYDNVTPPRTLNVLQELRDISSMAMEHFEEKIVPLLKSKQESQCCPSYPIPGTYNKIMLQKHLFLRAILILILLSVCTIIF